MSSDDTPTDMTTDVATRSTPSTRSFANGVAVGLNYTGSLRLYNCVSDAECMAMTMKESFHVPVVTTITDTPGSAFPTKTLIFGSLKNLVKKSKGSAVIFSMSSHGFNIPDVAAGDETDRNDEAVLCADTQSITDDEIYRCITYQGSTSCIVIVIDACHSGTIVDLPYSFDGSSWKLNTRRSTRPRAFVVGVSGARDTETASDGSGSNGAFTEAFLEIISQLKGTVSYDMLYNILSEKLIPQGQRPVITCSRSLPSGAMFVTGGKLVVYS
jgi:hypothetical protein